MNSSGSGNGHGVGRGNGHGRNSGRSFGANGYCICAKCSEKILHQRGVKCTSVKCPSCNHVMVREELLNKKRNYKW
ncbi:MAG: hypothetical protein GY936_18905 [Ignavibacteriae bacterium]|nr:hypothetical protein [Ignavibacteriota bacterium]